MISLFKKARTLGIILFIKYPVYYVAFLFPRKSNRWVLGSHYGFVDNSKYLFLEVICSYSEIKAYYLFYDKEEYLQYKDKFPCLYYKSLKGIWYILTNKVFIGTHGLGFGLPRVMTGGALYVELWHGIVLKKMGYLDKFSGQKIINSRLYSFLHRVFFKFTSQYIKRDLFLSTSKTVTSLYSATFNLSEDKFIEANYPRCKPFYLKESELKSRFIKYETEAMQDLFAKLDIYKKIYIYMPTWRDHNPMYLGESGIDFNKLNSLMVEEDSLFLFKLHPNTPQSSLSTLSKYSNLVLLPNKMDVYTFLPKVDVLITDYSSIYIDFMHSKKGSTIFFPFDYDDYIAKSRELAFDYNENINGIRVDSFDELLFAIKEEKYKDFDADKKNDLFIKFWGFKQDKVDLVQQIKSIA